MIKQLSKSYSDLDVALVHWDDALPLYIDAVYIENLKLEESKDE